MRPVSEDVNLPSDELAIQLTEDLYLLLYIVDLVLCAFEVNDLDCDG